MAITIQGITVDKIISHDYFTQHQNRGTRGLSPLAAHGIGDERRARLEALLYGSDYEARSQRLRGAISHAPFILVHDTANLPTAYPTAWLQPTATPLLRRTNHARVPFEARHIGNIDSHAIGIRATSRQIPNDWLQIGTTAIKAPKGSTPLNEATAGDGRNVIQTPTAWASHDASYSANRVTSNPLAPILCDLAGAANPEQYMDDLVAFVKAGTRTHESDAQLKGNAIENAAQIVTWKADGGIDIGPKGSLEGTAATWTITPPTWTRAAYDATPRASGFNRQDVRLDNGFTWSIHDNGNVTWKTNGQTFTVTGSPERSLGTGQFHHDLDAYTRLCCTSDFTSTSGVIDATDDDAIFWFVQTDAVSGALDARLTEALMETSVQWTLERF